MGVIRERKCRRVEERGGWMFIPYFSPSSKGRECIGRWVKGYKIEAKGKPCEQPYRRSHSCMSYGCIGGIGTPKPKLMKGETCIYVSLVCQLAAYYLHIGHLGSIIL